MSIFYLDSSAWVKRHESEEGTAWMGRIWRPHARFACANLGLIEVLSAISRRHAAHSIEEALTAQVLQTVQREYDAFVQVGLDGAVLGLAKVLAPRYRLRGADCVHLASALHLRAVQDDAVMFIGSDA